MKNRIIEICELGQPQSIIHRENQPITELIKTDSLIQEINQQLRLHVVSHSFIAVSKKEPPKHKELLVQSPDGQNYLASWREACSIFTCQNKGEDSLDWRWKEI